MEIPPGFEIKKGMMCRLKKALYGLKQSPRSWFGRFSKVLIKLWCRQSHGDHTLLIRDLKIGKMTAFLVYVDDIVVTGDD